MNWFANLTTRSKLVLGFGLVILLMAVAILNAIDALAAEHQSQKGVEDVLNLRVNLNGQRAALLLASLLPPGPAQEAQFDEIAGYSSENTTTIGRLMTSYGTDRELAADVQAIKAVRTEYVAIRDKQLIPMIREQKYEEAKSLIIGAQAGRFQKIRENSREITRLLDRRSESRIARMKWVSACLGAGALLIALGMVLGLDRLIAAPLTRIAAMARKFAEGDLRVEIAASDRKDEIGVLTRAFHGLSRSLAALAGRARQIAGGDLTAEIKPQSEHDILGNAFASMTGSLRGLIGELVEAAGVLASSTAEIASATTQIAASTSETATAVTETTATIAEFRQAATQSSEMAEQVSDQVRKVADVSQTGRISVDAVVSGMAGIRGQMDSIASSILALNSQRQKIGEILTSVDDLANQSRMLAINASMEAAKAGDEGKGFAVVAHEVKNLAEQSRQATNRVRTILLEIEKATNSAVLTTEQGSKAVDQGVRQSVSAGDSIAALANSVTESAHASAQIAAASHQQSIGIDQVALAMQNIQTACSKMTGGARQADAEARRLVGLGQKLGKLVANFKV